MDLEKQNCARRISSLFPLIVFGFTKKKIFSQQQQQKKKPCQHAGNRVIDDSVGTDVFLDSDVWFKSVREIRAVAGRQKPVCGVLVVFCGVVKFRIVVSIFNIKCRSRHWAPRIFFRKFRRNDDVFPTVQVTLKAAKIAFRWRPKKPTFPIFFFEKIYGDAKKYISYI